MTPKDKPQPSIGEIMLPFQVHFNLPSDVVPDFQIARDVFQEVGFGSLDLKILGDPAVEPTVTISLVRDGGGQPAIYASYLAAQATYIRRDGVTDKVVVKEFLVKVATHLLTDKELQEIVMSESLSRTSENLLRVLQSTQLQANLFGVDDERGVKGLILSNLKDQFPNLTPPNKVESLF